MSPPIVTPAEIVFGRRGGGTGAVVVVVVLVVVAAVVVGGGGVTVVVPVVVPVVAVWATADGVTASSDAESMPTAAQATRRMKASPRRLTA